MSCGILSPWVWGALVGLLLSNKIQNWWDVTSAKWKMTDCILAGSTWLDPLPGSLPLGNLVSMLWWISVERLPQESWEADHRSYEIISLLFQVIKLGSDMSCNNRYTNYARHIVVNKTVKSQLKLQTQKLDFLKVMLQVHVWKRKEVQT